MATLHPSARHLVMALRLSAQSHMDDELITWAASSKPTSGVLPRGGTLAATQAAIVYGTAGEVWTTTNGGVTWDSPEVAALKSRVEVWDDFTGYQAGHTELDHPWILNSGGDAQALDPAVVAAEGGLIRCVTGNADGAVANDGSQFVWAVPVQADSGGLVMEARVRIATAVTAVSVNIGFTDVSTLEEPFSVSGTTITSVASDAACFVYDTAMTTDEWWAIAVDGDTDDTGSGTTAVVPVADTYQDFRIEVSADGNTIKFFIANALVKTLTGGGISPSVNLFATVIANATTTTSKTVDVDYIYVGVNR